MPATRPNNPNTGIHATKPLTGARTGAGKTAARRWDSTRSSAKRREAARADGLAGFPGLMMVLCGLSSGQICAWALAYGAGGRVGAGAAHAAISLSAPSGHVAHRTDTIARVAVDHPYSAPENILTLASPSSGPRMEDMYVTDWSEPSLGAGR